MPFRYYRRAKGFTLQEHSTRQITPRRWPEREKSPQLLPLRRQGGDQLLNFLTEAGAVQPFLAEAPPGFGERHETELMHPKDRRGWSSSPAFRDPRPGSDRQVSARCRPAAPPPMSPMSQPAWRAESPPESGPSSSQRPEGLVPQSPR